MAEVVVAVANGRTQGEYLMDLYQGQTKYRRIYLEDIAGGYLDAKGEVKLIQRGRPGIAVTISDETEANLIAAYRNAKPDD